MSMNPKGRPLNEKVSNFQHAERNKKPQQIQQHWTEHRLTLIAFQAQYVYAKQPNQFHQIRKEDVESKKKGSRKKVNLQYQSAFLSIQLDESQDIKVEQLSKNYDGLNNLFHVSQDKNSLMVRQFIKILLELKHSVIVKQFCEIYNIIFKQTQKIQFRQVQKEEPRFQLLENVKNKIVSFIVQNKQKFPYFTDYLLNDQKQTKRLLLVEAYCIVAQKFKFNINQFYSQAFSVSFDSSPSKKVKKG